MTTRWQRLVLVGMCVGVGVIGCGRGERIVEPQPSPAGAEIHMTPEDQPERALEEGGADAGLPPEQRSGTD